MAAKKKTTAKKKPAAKRTVKRKVAAKKAPAKRKVAAKKAPAKRKVAAKKAPAKRKVAAKKAPAKRKVAAKKAPAKRKVAVKKAPVKKAVKRATGPINKAYSKTQIVSEIAEHTELSKKQVSEVFEELGGMIERHLKPRAAGSFTLPGLIKLVVVRKPATKARKGINPFTGEPTTFKAKPARNIVKGRPLKKLKDMAA